MGRFGEGGKSIVEASDVGGRVDEIEEMKREHEDRGSSSS